MNITRTKEMDLRSSDYEFLTSVAGANLSAGVVLVVEEQLGFILADVVSGKSFTLITKASQVRALKATEAITSGDKIFWDAANDVVTKTSAVGVIPCGYAMESALVGSAGDYLLINFDGRTPVAVPAA